MSRIIKIVFLGLTVIIFPLGIHAEPVLNNQADKALTPVKINNNEVTGNAVLPIDIYNSGVESQLKGNVKEAIRKYTKAINLSSKYPDIRSRAYQNLGVIDHNAARELIIKDPEKSLTALKKVEQNYRRAMQLSPDRPNAAANMQLLLNDTQKAETIIQKRKEMNEKKKIAREKIKDALDKQVHANITTDKVQKEKLQKDAGINTEEARQATNDYKKVSQEAYSPQDVKLAEAVGQDLNNAKNNQLNLKLQEAEQNLRDALKKLTNNQEQNNQQNQDQKQNNNQNNQGQNNQNKNQDKQNQKRNNAQQKTKEALDKQKEANNSENQNDKEKQQQEAKQKTEEAQKAIDDYKNSLNKDNKEQKKNAEEAQEQIKQAQENQDKNNPEKAEQNLQKAMDSLNKNDDKNDKDQEKSKAKQQPDKNRPQPDQPQPQKQQYKNKNIDKDQAEAILKLMTEDEKTLNNALKDKQKEAYGIAPVQKNW